MDIKNVNTLATTAFYTVRIDIEPSVILTSYNGSTTQGATPSGFSGPAMSNLGLTGRRYVYTATVQLAGGATKTLAHTLYLPLLSAVAGTAAITVTAPGTGESGDAASRSFA